MLSATCVADAERVVSATLVVLSESPNQYDIFFNHKSGLSVNILHASDKSPVQRGFFTNILGFWAGCIIFVIFVILFSLI